MSTTKSKSLMPLAIKCRDAEDIIPLVSFLREHRNIAASIAQLDMWMDSTEDQKMWTTSATPAALLLLCRNVRSLVISILQLEHNTYRDFVHHLSAELPALPMLARMCLTTWPKELTAENLRYLLQFLTQAPKLRGLEVWAEFGNTPLPQYAADERLNVPKLETLVLSHRHGGSSCVPFLQTFGDGLKRIAVRWDDTNQAKLHELYKTGGGNPLLGPNVTVFVADDLRNPPEHATHANSNIRLLTPLTNLHLLEIEIGRRNISTDALQLMLAESLERNRYLRVLSLDFLHNYAKPEFLKEFAGSILERYCRSRLRELRIMTAFLMWPALTKEIVAYCRKRRIRCVLIPGSSRWNWPAVSGRPPVEMW